MKLTLSIMAAIVYFVSGAEAILIAQAFEGGWATRETYICLALLPVFPVWAFMIVRKYDANERAKWQRSTGMMP